MSFYPVVLCSASNQDFWPLTQTGEPKEVLPLFGEHSLLAGAIARLPASSFKPILVCPETHYASVSEKIRSSDAADAAFLLEPDMRGSAPSIALTALFVAETRPDGVLVVLPADLFTADQGALKAAIAEAADAAAEGWLVALGTFPREPDPDYDYVRRSGEPIVGRLERATHFATRPTYEAAEVMLDEGGWLRSSGIFVCRADRYLDELERYSPDILEACRAAIADAHRENDVLRPAREAFMDCRAETIGSAVFGCSDRATVLPCDFVWSRIDNWLYLLDVLNRDAAGNAVIGNVVMENASCCFVRSEGPRTVVIGASELAVVVTDDAVLVASLDALPDVDAVISRMDIKRVIKGRPTRSDS